MSTRSMILIERKEAGKKRAKYEGVYCHWDGYPEGVGQILALHYDTLEKVEELIELGDLSSLGERVKPDEGEEHSFDHPIRNVTVAYHRDRGEDLRRYKLDTFKKVVAPDDTWCEYVYVFRISPDGIRGNWYYDEIWSGVSASGLRSVKQYLRDKGVI